MGSADFLYKGFLSRLQFEPTPCQDELLHKLADFVSSDDDDIFVVNGYAGTGKTTAISSVISTLTEYKTKCVLLAPTGRAAKVLSSYAGRPAYTIHKHIYRQKAVGGDGFGQFSLAPNKDKHTLFVVDEVSLISIDPGQQQSSAAFGTGNLLEDLLTFVRSGVECKVILIGDSAQLPPIGLDASPALSKEYMAMMGGTVFSELTTVVRQQQESGILRNATMIRQTISELNECGGIMDIFDLGLDVSGCDDIQRISGGELIEAITDAYSRYGEDEAVILCRSNRRAIKYNLGIRSTVQFKEEKLVRDDKLMIVKNCYQFLEGIEGMDYIANGDIARVKRIRRYEEQFGFRFADVTLTFPDYDDYELDCKIILDTLHSESPSLTQDQSRSLFFAIEEDYAHITAKSKRYKAIREDAYYNALQVKFAYSVTCHKAQGGPWPCVFVDKMLFGDEEISTDLMRWLYTALTRATEQLYLINFDERFFEE